MKTDASEIVSRLRAFSKRVEHDEERFRDCPLFVLWVSAEGSAPNWDAKHIDEADASHFLMIPRENVVAIGEMESRNPNDLLEWSPFYAYFKPDMVPDETRVAQDIRRQVAAIKSVCAGLEKEVMAMPRRMRELYHLPLDVNFGIERANWWKTLFHLAIHYPPTSRGELPHAETRRRWVNVFENAIASGDLVAAPPSIRNTDKIPEFQFQLEYALTTREDIWPGTIWCELNDDIFTSTMQAIDLLILLVEQADVAQPPPDTSKFSELLKKFEKLAAQEEAVKPQSVVHNIGHDDGEDEYYARSEPLLLRIGSPFSTPSVREWCDAISPFADKFIELARWHNFVEFVTVVRVLEGSHSRVLRRASWRCLTK